LMLGCQSMTIQFLLKPGGKYYINLITFQF